MEEKEGNICMETPLRAAESKPAPNHALASLFLVLLLLGKPSLGAHVLIMLELHLPWNQKQGKNVQKEKVKKKNKKKKVKNPPQNQIKKQPNQASKKTPRRDRLA